MATSNRAPANRKESNLWQNAKTLRWHWEVDLKRPDGTAYRKAGSRKSESEARSARDAAFADYNQSQGRAGRWTVRSWSEHVQHNVWPEELSDTSCDAYAYSLKNHILPKLGGAKLNALTVPALQEWTNKLVESHGRNVAANALKTLGSVLTRAVEGGFITVNPARNVKLRKVPQAEESKMILDPQQQKRLLAASQGTCMELPILLGLRFGMRMGECLGLRWVDVDLDRQEIRISQQAQYVKGKGIQLTDPKTKQGTRMIPIPDALKATLTGAKAAAQTDFVCVRNGNMISAKKASHYFRSVAIKAGFTESESIPTHHDLRSTFLTHLANDANDGLGVKPHVLMAIAGHSNLTTTMKYYVRASDADLRAAMSCVS